MEQLTREEIYAKVKSAFKKIRKHNLIARINHLCCMSCASSDLDRQCEDRDKDGAVYFHRQDYDGFFRDFTHHEKKKSFEGIKPLTSTLHIRFLANKDELSVWVGRLAVEALTSEGLTVNWDGNPSKTIGVEYKYLTSHDRPEVAKVH